MANAVDRALIVQTIHEIDRTFHARFVGGAELVPYERLTAADVARLEQTIDAHLVGTAPAPASGDPIAEARYLLTESVVSVLSAFLPKPAKPAAGAKK